MVLKKLLLFSLLTILCVVIIGRCSLILNPLEKSSQIILAVVQDVGFFQVKLFFYQREESSWNLKLGSIDGVIGKKGYAWGQSPLFKVSSKNIKKEGDLKTPAGIFKLNNAWGYSNVKPKGMEWPYHTITKDIIAVDDPDSKLYNRIVNTKHLAKKDMDYKSYEIMKRRDDLYKWLIEIKHNYEEPIPAGGSAIFLHVWKSSLQYTAGCVAVSEKNMLRILKYLKPEKEVLFILLPIKEKQFISDIVFNELGFKY